jgi:hypothetical protein
MAICSGSQHGKCSSSVGGSLTERIRIRWRQRRVLFWEKRHVIALRCLDFRSTRLHLHGRSRRTSPMTRIRPAIIVAIHWLVMISVEDVGCDISVYFAISLVVCDLRCWNTGRCFDGRRDCWGGTIEVFFRIPIGGEACTPCGGTIWEDDRC